MAFACPLLIACHRGEALGRPTASLSDTTGASRDFERIRVAWGRNDPAERPELRREIEAFCAAHPNDGVTPLARIYWALSLMDPPADWPQAERRLGDLSPPRPGSAHDLYIVAVAKLRRFHHHPDAAFELLRPLVGTIVDVRGRALLQEELTFDALEAREPYEAIAYMDAWLRGASEEDRQASEAKVAVALGAVPEAALRGSLQAMRTSAKAGQSHGYGIAIERLVGERLGQIAVERGDASLARWLLDPDAEAPSLGEEVAVALGQLATSRRGIGSVAGRTVGLVLPTTSTDLRDEAADVLRGVLWALEIGGEASGQASPAQAVRLVTRDDGGDPGRVRAGLEEVAGEGASVIITALDGDASEQALEWAASSTLNVIVLATPRSLKTRPDAPRAASGFSVGESWSAELRVLAAALAVHEAGTPRPGTTRRTLTDRVATLADSEAASSLVEAAATPGAPWESPLSCDTALKTAGESRFPLAAWEHAGVQRWLVAGSTACAEDLFRGIGRSSRRGVIGLTLEASEVVARPVAGLRLVTAAAGVVPLGSSPPEDPRAVDVRALVARTGARPAWWTALGRDAAVLARMALSSLPLDSTSDVDEIARRRAVVRQALVDARAPLWTSDHEGFDATRNLPRSIRLVDLNH